MTTRYQFVDDSGETRLSGTLAPGPTLMLGPYDFDHTTPNLASDWVQLGSDLATGTVISRCICVITDAWADAGKVQVGVGDPAGDFVPVFNSSVDPQTTGTGSLVFAGCHNQLNNIDEAGSVSVFAAGAGIWVTVDTSPSAGAASVYLLVNVPA